MQPPDGMIAQKAGVPGPGQGLSVGAEAIFLSGAGSAQGVLGTSYTGFHVCTFALRNDNYLFVLKGQGV